MKRTFVVPTRNVVLADHEAGLVDRLIRSGRYKNASEVLREGLRLLERREETEAAKLVALPVALDKAETAAPAGAPKDSDKTSFDEIERQA